MHSWSLPGANGLPILGDTRTRAGDDEPAGTVLIAHGFKGYKDYGFLPRLAERLAQTGLATVTFNFSHSGMTERDGPFTRPDLFALDTWNKQVFDWHALAAAVRRADLPGVPWEPASAPFCFFGHSRGGLSALLAAARLPDNRRPAALVTAAAPADASRLGEEDAAALRAGRAIDSPSGRTGQTLRVMPGWLLEQDADPEGHDPVRAARALGEAGVPLLVLHGTADRTVDPADASRIAAAAGTTPRLIDGASHVFNAPNPMGADDEVPAATAHLFEETLSILSRIAGTPV